MSGTSLDGIDVAQIASDGHGAVVLGPSLTMPYPDDFRERLRAILGKDEPAAEIEAVEAELTQLHAEMVAVFRKRHPDAGFDLVGFHGHTIWHRPAERRTRQIGDGARLARLLGVDVVADFRSADVAAGGEGAPLAPLYHAALASPLAKPVAILNLGGVANVTWIGEDDDIVAFDTGPGNALIDDWARRHAGRPADFGGALAAAGQVFPPQVTRFLAHPYFARKPPKSLDRDEFWQFVPNRLGLADRAAALTRRPPPPPAFSGAGAGVSGLRRRPAQPGADGGIGAPSRGPGAPGRGGRLGRRRARGAGLRLSRDPLGIGIAAEPAVDHRRPRPDARRAVVSRSHLSDQLVSA